MKIFIYMTLTILAMGIIILDIVALGKNTKAKKILIDDKRELGYPEVLNIINLTLKREIEFKFKEMRLRDIKHIYNFEETLNDLVTRTMTSFNETFLREVDYYHTREYLVTFITKELKFFLIEYLEKNKIRTK